MSAIILFDGVCNLCNSTVQFIIKRDKHNTFQFASLQGAFGQHQLRLFNLPTTVLNSFVLIENGVAYTRSTAALRVAKQLKGGWRLLYALIAVPKFIRDAVYNRIAKNRYKWFGKKEACPIPTPDQRARFLD